MKIKELILTSEELLDLSNQLTTISQYIAPSGARRHQATSAQVTLYIVSDKINRYANEIQRWKRYVTHIR